VYLHTYIYIYSSFRHISRQETFLLQYDIPYLVCYHGFIDRIKCFVRKYASRKAGNNLYNIMLMSSMKYIVIYLYIITLQSKIE